MSDIIKAQLWQVHVKSGGGTHGYSVVTVLDAPISWVEDIAMQISESQGPNRQVLSINRTATVYTRRVLHE